MDLKELIWLAHGMEMRDAIDAISMAEWSSKMQYMKCSKLPKEWDRLLYGA